MALKEHDNNIITKEQNDPVTIYLKNIIQRYFQIENEISQETKEAIIIQAYTRLKEFLNAFTNQYIICINEKSGAIDLAIRDFGGEEAFDKNNAFNKDFCDTTTQTKTLYDGTEETYNNFGRARMDHMVSGDDDRLYDARIPLAHVHTIDDIAGLREFLNGYHLIDGGLHVHNNIKFLNMLFYTGSRVSIDLILLEDLVSKVEKTVERLEETNIYFNTTAQHYINQLQNIFTPIYKKLEYVDNNINSWLVDWVQNSKIYTNVKEGSLRKYIVEFSKQYLSNEEYLLLKETLEKSIRVIGDKTFDVSQARFTDPIIETTNTSTIQKKYHSVPFDVKKGYTKIALNTQSSTSVPSNALSKIYGNNILNSIQKFYFEYTKDGVTYSDELPHIYQVNNSRHDFILVYANVDETNTINAYFKRLSYLPVYLYNPIIINAYASDKSNKDGNAGYLILTKDDTSNKSNNSAQGITTQKNSDSTSSSFDNLTVTVNAYKANISDAYNTRSTVRWTLDHFDDHSYRLFRRENEGKWKDLMASTSFSSSDTGVLQTVYNEGHVYSMIENSGEQIEQVTLADKQAVWKITSDGHLTSTVNNSNYDVLLTNEYYNVYRHRATLTCNSSQNDGDNDVIAIVISAVNINGRIHTLSLVCNKAGEGHTFCGKGCHLIYNYSQPDALILETFSHNGSNGGWYTDVKINFDIKKDKRKIIINTSGFYTMAGLDNYDGSRTSSTPSLRITLSEIQSRTGVDFFNGMVGYGNFSQQDATVIGINLETFSTYIGNEYPDSFDDLSAPNIPNLTGRCTGVTNGTEQYDVTIDYSDAYEKIDYKLCVYADIDWDVDTSETAMQKYNNPVHAANPIYITKFSDLDSFHWGIGFDTSPFSGNSTITVVSETNISTYKKRVILKRLMPEFNDVLYFCDNTYEDTAPELTTYLNDFNAKLCAVDNTNKNYLKAIMLLQEAEEPFYHVGNDAEGGVAYFCNDVFIDSDKKWNYYGEFRYGILNDFFPYAKIRCQILLVPGKGEDDA